MSEGIKISFFEKHLLYMLEIISAYYPINEDLLKKYEDKWNWDKISDNKHINWNEALLEKYYDKLLWQNLSRGDNHNGNQFKQNAPIVNHRNHEYSQIQQIYTLELLKKYEDDWNWDELCRNEYFAPSEKIIIEFQNSWNWYFLSLNQNIHWNLALLKKFEYHWDWSELSNNPSLPWSSELLERFKDRWSWYSLSSCRHLKWSVSLIRKFEDYWDWHSLTQNPALPWSLDFIEKLSDKLDWTELQNYGLYQLVFQNLIDEPLIAQLMERSGQYGYYGIAMQTYRQKSEWYDLIYVCDKLIKHFPDYAEAYLHRGIANYEQNNYTSVIADLQKVIKFQPDCSEAYFYLACLQYDLSDFEQAVQFCQRAIDIKPDDILVLKKMVGIHKQLKQYKEAKYWIEQAILGLGEEVDFELYAAKGEICYYSEDYLTSIDSFDKAIAINTNEAEAFYLRGMSKFSLGKIQAACDDWRSAQALYHLEAGKMLKKYGR